MKEHLRFILCQLDFPRCLFLICCRLFKGFHQAGRVPEEVLDVKFRTWQNLPEPQFFYLLSQLESHLTPWNPWSTWTSLAATFGTKIFHLFLVLLVSHPTCHAGFLVFKSWLLLVDIDPPSPFSVRSNWPSRLFSTPWRSGSKFIFHNIFDLHKCKRSRHTTDCAKLGKPRMSSHPLKANLEHSHEWEEYFTSEEKYCYITYWRCRAHPHDFRYIVSPNALTVLTPFSSSEEKELVAVIGVTNLWGQIATKLCMLFVGSSLGRCIGPARWWRWPVRNYYCRSKKEDL